VSTVFAEPPVATILLLEVFRATFTRGIAVATALVSGALWLVVE
jgi:hypothetical protein